MAHDRDRVAPRQRLQECGQIGLPQTRSLLVQLDGEGQFPWQIRRLANIDKGFLPDQVIEQGAQESSRSGELGLLLDDGGWGIGAWRLCASYRQPISSCR